MDRAISASDANQRFSEMLRDVRDGDSFVVTSRGRPVARISPIDDQAQQSPAIDALLAFVSTLPLRCLADWQRQDLYS